MTDLAHDCDSPLHPRAAEGLRLFNAGKYFEAHEALEIAWLEERGKVRDLYRGILQVGVAYLHITRGNYAGAIKVHDRSVKWLKSWPDHCRGIDVRKLREDAGQAIAQVIRLGKERIGEFNTAMLKPVRWEEGSGNQSRIYICDRCGSEMVEQNCKITCPNCGNRFDCSDLNIYFD
jgi:predicted metal-dependent hydrolase